MNLQTQREIRLGLTALVLTGILYTLSVVIRGPLDRDPAALMRAALSFNFVPGVALGLIGGVLQIYGLFGLYRYLTYQRESLIAFLAIMFVWGIVPVLALVTFLAVNVPVIARLYEQGDQGVITVVESNFSGQGLTLLGISSLASIVNGILLAVAIWRDQRLPRWIGVVWGLKAVLLALSGPGLYATELLGAVLTLLTASVIAWHGWQDSTLERGKGERSVARGFQSETRICMIAHHVNTNRGIWLRAASVLYCLSIVEWLEQLPILQDVIRDGTLPIRHAFGQTFHAMDGPIMQAWGPNAIVASILAFGLLSAFQFLAGYWLWKRQMSGNILALVLLPVYWLFAIGWAVPYMLLMGALKAIALGFGWKSAR